METLTMTPEERQRYKKKLAKSDKIAQSITDFIGNRWDGEEYGVILTALADVVAAGILAWMEDEEERGDGSGHDLARAAQQVVLDTIAQHVEDALDEMETREKLR